MAVAIALTLRASGAESVDSVRPVTSVYGLEIGGANINCNYLSPLPYTGTGVAWYGGWGKAMKQHPRDLVMDFTAGLDFTSSGNPAKTTRMLGVGGRFGWGPNWRKTLAPGWELTLGGALDLSAHLLWLPVNGNNPVQVMAYTGIDLTAGLSWKTRLGRLPVTFADRASLPTAGVFFCPEYGEAYYEIYLGNHSNLAHFGWWGNCFGIDNHLTMTLHFRNRRSLVLGYRLDVRTNHANNLTNQYVRNAFTVAIQIN